MSRLWDLTDMVKYTYYDRDQTNIEVRAGDLVVAPMDRWRFGIVLKVFPPDSEEARDWDLHGGGYLVKFDGGTLLAQYGDDPDDEMFLLQRIKQYQEQEWRRFLDVKSIDEILSFFGVKSCGYFI